MLSEKTAHALGICAKAGALIYGTPMICDALRGDRRRPALVLAASDVSENTAKRLRDRCAYYRVEPVFLPCRMEELSAAVGKSAGIAAVAVTDRNLCRLVQSTLGEAENAPSPGEPG